MTKGVNGFFFKIGVGLFCNAFCKTNLKFVESFKLGFGVGAIVCKVSNSSNFKGVFSITRFCIRSFLLSLCFFISSRNLSRLILI